MTYYMIGADGKTYGPIGEEQLRRWLAEGRANARTLVYAEGAKDWVALGQVPAFCPAPAAAAAPPPGAPPAAPALISAVPVRGTNGLATAGFVFGLLAWLPPCCCLPCNLVGLILSIIALAQLNRPVPRQDGRGLAIAGLVLSALSLLMAAGMILFNLAFGDTSFHWQTNGW